MNKHDKDLPIPQDYRDLFEHVGWVNPNPAENDLHRICEAHHEGWVKVYRLRESK